MLEKPGQFEKRKQEHIRIALDPRSQASGSSGLENISLIHEALPELNFSDIQLTSQFAGTALKSPIYISSMTAGHAGSGPLNLLFAEAAQNRGWAMGVGSQRKELNDPEAAQEWSRVRKIAPNAVLFGNLGLTQVIKHSTESIQRLVDNLQAAALFVHTNPLQEVLQAEGTPDFRGGTKRLADLVRDLGVPVILKEVGCGFSARTLEHLQGLGLYAVDIAGFGGTHWGRIEGYRADAQDWRRSAAETFKDWGIGTLTGVLAALELQPDYQIWASGGVRTGLDVAKYLTVGAQMVGVAQPLLEAATLGERALDGLMERLENELKIAMFCTGCENVNVLQQRKVWTWK